MYGSFGNLAPAQHVRELTDAINVAAFLCSEYCIVPPGFIAECNLAQRAVLRRRSFLDERVIRLPLRESDLDVFWEKKRQQYAPFRNEYSGLFDPRSEKLVHMLSHSIVTRKSRIGDELVRAWEEAPDTDVFSRALVSGLSAHQIEKIRRTPGRIAEKGLAVTWPAVRSAVQRTAKAEPSRVRSMIQHHYFGIYIREYNLRVITGLPFALRDFGLGPSDLRYNYDALKAALETIECWQAVLAMSASSMYALRRTAPFSEFRRAFDEVAANAASSREVSEVFAAAYASAGSRLSGSLVFAADSRRAPARGIDFSEEEIGLIAERLHVVGIRAAEVSQAPSETLRGRSARSRVSMTGSQHRRPRVAVFVALKMEREMLVRRWNLEKPYGAVFWKGELGGAEVEVFCPDEMGRVSAAISTMEYLSKQTHPDLLVVAGIAGGFERADVSLGSLIIPTDVADLAMRKIVRDAKIPEFRPKEYQTDPRLRKYLNSSTFNREEWERSVIIDAEWPQDRRPGMHEGVLACGDEVVASSDWIGQLLAVWPKLLGIDMESGGVCAAARTANMEVAVVRGVSDLADPSKSDTEWRRRAMKTVAHFLESIDYDVLCGAPPV